MAFMTFPNNIIAQLVGLVPVTWSSACHLLLYVLNALALYTLANSRGLKGAWLSWVPVANIWVLGSLSDQYSYLVQRRSRSRRVLLVVLRVVITLSWGLMLGVVAAALFRAFSMMPYDIGFILGYCVTRSGPLLAGLLICTVILELWYAVIRYIALHHIYRSCDPENAVLLLILSILIPMVKPIILFLNRNKEAGMPPRKQPAQPDIQE